MYPSLIEIGSNNQRRLRKTLHKQTDRQTDKQTLRKQWPWTKN